MQTPVVMLSPLTPGVITSGGQKLKMSHQDLELVSPSTHRVASLASPTPLQPHMFSNDDEAERRARRRSRMVEMQRTGTLGSPATPETGENRRRSLPYGGLNKSQLAEHYANCIKLSAENKITSKNAFGLHLIDYMSELLKKKELDNFQVASSTLDASAKIYAGRVDAIHSETYKVLSGLGRSEKKASETQGEENDAEIDKGPVEKKRKKRKAKTIETNLKNITLDKFDLEFEVDPLFEKTAAAFDEGGTGGLLLNHLQFINGSMQLIMDSNTVVTGEEAERACLPETAKQLVDLTEFRDIYNGVKFDSLQICPSFADFEFTNWEKGSTDLFTSMIQKMARSDHAFDMDAEPEPVAGPSGTEMDQLGDVSYMDDDGGSEVGNESMHSDLALVQGDSSEARMVETAIDNMKHGTIGNLMQVLSTEPGEYSYFKTDGMKMWAGPEHWKPSVSNKLPLDTRALLANEQKEKKSKEKKAAFKLDFDQNVDVNSHFKETKAATTNSKTTVKKYKKSKNTLPADSKYTGDRLFRLFNKPRCLVKREQGGVEVQDEGVGSYDYENENDRQNFCPGVGGAEDDGDEGVDLDFTAVSSQSQEMDSQGSFETSALNQSVFLGDNLVAQPNKVARIDIDYAKTAKKVDVKRLKAAMWNLLTSPEEKKDNPENQEDKGGGQEEKRENEEQEKRKDTIPGQVSFQNMLDRLPEKLPKHMSKNLSVPIAFVSLLHLANEKSLAITGNKEMSDLYISQDSKD